MTCGAELCYCLFGVDERVHLCFFPPFCANLRAFNVMVVQSFITVSLSCFLYFAMKKYNGVFSAMRPLSCTDCTTKYTDDDEVHFLYFAFLLSLF